MFGRDKLHDEIRGLRMDADNLRRQRDEARTERDEATAEIRKFKREADEARRKARELERRLELMQAEPQQYIVQTEGREITVIAVTHDEAPDGELLLLDREEAVVAAFKTYSGFRIEPLPAE